MEDQSITSIATSRTQTIMSALSSLSPHQFSDLTHSLSSDLRLHSRRRLSLLLSPPHFSHTLHFLHSLSHHQKSLLIARYHLSILKHLTCFFDSSSTAGPGLVRLRDLDAALLLLLLCEVRQHDSQALHTCPSNWRRVLNDYIFCHMLTVSGLGVFPMNDGALTVSAYVERVARFLDAIMCAGGGGGKEDRVVATAAAAVVALPSVDVRGGGCVCVVCKEEMREGRDVCELPCGHLFHWGCILPWLKKRNTCPCCRFRLPTDDVVGEIERLWGILEKKSRLEQKECALEF